MLSPAYIELSGAGGLKPGDIARSLTGKRVSANSYIALSTHGIQGTSEERRVGEERRRRVSAFQVCWSFGCVLFGSLEVGRGQRRCGIAAGARRLCRSDAVAGVHRAVRRGRSQTG